jgi:NAD+ diphosphatase
MPVHGPDSAMLTELALARGRIDRQEERRADEAWLAEMWRSPVTRVIGVRDGVLPIRDGSAGPTLRWTHPGDVPEDVERLLLGTDGDGHTWFAARMEVDAPCAGLREMGADLSADEVALATTAIALDNWHSTHPRCSRCGEPTVAAAAGWIRRCAADGSEHYPRTDPAVIMLVLDADDRALLGRQGRWQPTWFSTLAGFVEPGESAEAAVRREVREEAGVTVDTMTYLGSQPWPFPCSLMLGFHARAITTDIRVDGTEIVEARWFSRAELAAACALGEVALPPAVSIARRLIEHWYGEPLPGDWIRP